MSRASFDPMLSPGMGQPQWLYGIWNRSCICLYRSLMNFKYFKSKNVSPSVPHTLYQMHRIALILPLYHYCIEHQYFKQKYIKKSDSLVDKVTHIFRTIGLVFFRNKLMRMPYEIYIQSWYKDCAGRWSHEIQETNKLVIKLEIRIKIINCKRTNAWYRETACCSASSSPA